MATLWSDLRYGLRLLRHAPGFTASAVIALALGIGANTAIFSTVDAVLLRPLPFADPDRVVMVWEDNSGASFPRNTPASGNFVDWKQRNRVFTDMAATRGASANLTADGPPEQVVGRATTANFFDVLGVKPAAGTRDSLVVLEVAAALILMVGAGLMLQTVARLRAIDIGFRPGNLLTLRTTLPRTKYQDPEKRIGFYHRVLQAVLTLPGVERAGYGSVLPFRSIGNTQSYRVEGRDPLPGDALLRVTSGDYLQTLGVRLVQGRLLLASDTDQSAPVIVINETLARLHFPKENPLGHRIAMWARQPVWRTIVGVVHDVHERGYELAMKPGVYIPFEQFKDTWALPESLVLRTTGDPANLTSAVRRVIAETDAEQPVAAVATMDEIVALDVADRHQQMTLLTAFAALALLLASLGLYGLL